VGAASGGVWKTTDGANWIPLTDTQASLAIRSLALDATTSPVTIYAGTGERTADGHNFYGAGVLKSADDGQTWSASGEAAFSGATSGGVSIEALSVSPNSSTHRDVLAAASGSADAVGGGVWRSVDGGETWALVLTGGAGIVGFDVAFDSNDLSGMTAYAALGRDNASGVSGSACLSACGGLFISNDAGASWKRLVAFDQVTNQLFDRAQIGRVALALGASSAGKSAGKTILYAAIADAATGSADLLGVFKSDDGGSTWMRISDPPNRLCAGECSFAMTLRASASDPSLVFAGGSGLARSIDGGNSWQDVTTDRKRASLYPGQLAIALSRDGSVLYAGNENGVWNSTDVSNAGVAAESHTWNNLSGISSAAPLNIYELEGLCGPAWKCVGDFIRSGPARGLPERFQSSYSLDPQDTRVEYAGFSGFSGINGDALGHVFMTASGGAQWSDISGNLPNIPVNDLVVDPALADTLYVATDIGVFATSDRGSTWAPLGAGLPIVPVTSLALQPASRVLSAATFGRGAWELPLGGGTAFHLDSLSPASATAGAASFTLNVKGSGFTNQSTIRLNSTPLASTTLRPDGSLATVVPAKLLKAGGSISVSVVDNGSVSNSETLAVTNPVPTISSITPTSITVGNGEFTLTVAGTNFVTGSVVNFGNTSLTPIGSSSATSLTVEVPTSAIATAAVINVSVTNPTPGGGTSGTETFDVQDYALGPVTPTIATVAGGFTAQYKIPVTGLNGFNVPLTLTCSGVPANAVCSFSPTSVTPAASAVTETMLVTTESNSFAPTGGTGRRIPPDYRKYWPLIGGLAGFLILMAWISLRAGNQEWRRRFVLAACVAGIAFAGTLSGCVSGGAGGTAVGTYQITITAEATAVTTGSTTVTIASHEVMVTLIVTETQ
ncbi:MAG: hypothetical protein WB787_09550, partial [Candidatus Acidiferrales bacterium]